MNLREYFEGNKGFGVLATADKAGYVDAAVYASPHINEAGQALFIMAEKLSYSNIQQNPYACFIFKQEGVGYEGKRLFLKKVSETDDQKSIADSGLRAVVAHGDIAGEKRHLVTFAIEKEIPLVGAEKKSGSGCGCSCS